jgi:hypothetical protein
MTPILGFTPFAQSFFKVQKKIFLLSGVTRSHSVSNCDFFSTPTNPVQALWLEVCKAFLSQKITIPTFLVETIYADDIFKNCAKPTFLTVSKGFGVVFCEGASHV